MNQNSKGQINSDNKVEPAADLIEIFSSFQGEGLFVGAKQIFVRFAGCNLNCSYCDTKKEATVENASIDKVLLSVMALEKSDGRHHSVSLTGGEPLLHADFLKRFLPILKKKKFKIYLETNGTLTEELSRVIDHVDIVAMDIKLPSSTGQEPLWRKHSEFLSMSRKKDLFVKVIVTEKTERNDVVKARDIVVNSDNKLPFVIQPATIDNKGTTKVSRKALLEFMNLSEKRLSNVRVIPQVHKFMSIR
ncbi:MAG: 7-carboxy-7-deazaguanine synthase QueE [Candidatus Omnitrophica bacterium]|nr:7-carboxy-7-deazaguanine synthase QueE [Candidatus Omnitrophota bacterium]